MIRILYFASLRVALGCGEEQWCPPEGEEGGWTLGQLRQALIARGGVWSALALPHIRMAHNQTMAGEAARLAPGDEVAFFPPVTGG